APAEKKAIKPRMELYATTLSVLEVPARLSPSAMRSLTGSVIDVRVTASTRLNIFSAPTKTITIGRRLLFMVSAYLTRLDMKRYQGTMVTLNRNNAHTL